MGRSKLDKYKVFSLIDEAIEDTEKIHNRLNAIKLQFNSNDEW